jgi:glyoxylate/hydroxypyruvate reductase A
MAILVESNQPEWMTAEQIRDGLRPLVPDDTPVWAWPGDVDNAGTDLSRVELLACAALRPGLVEQLPNLKVVQKLGAGVETMAASPELPAHVRICRLRADTAAREMAEYCLAYVLQGHKDIRHYAAAQADRCWDPKEPVETAVVTVGVLGLGFIGGRIADLMRAVGFRVLGWSRSPKAIDGVDARHGSDALHPMLGACDYVCSVLPSTPETRGLIDAEALAAMKPGATIINVGRGDLIDSQALTAALDAGRPGHAVLDVLPEEPLPADHPLWTHPAVTITPHVSGWHVGGAFETLAETWRRMQADEPLLNEVDRAAGY